MPAAADRRAASTPAAGAAGARSRSPATVSGEGTSVSGTLPARASDAAMRPMRPLGAISLANAADGAPSGVTDGGPVMCQIQATCSGSPGVSPAAGDRTATRSVTK